MNEMMTLTCGVVIGLGLAVLIEMANRRWVRKQSAKAEKEPRDIVLPGQVRYWAPDSPFLETTRADVLDVRAGYVSYIINQQLPSWSLDEKTFTSMYKVKS